MPNHEGGPEFRVVLLFANQAGGREKLSALGAEINRRQDDSRAGDEQL